VNVIPLPTRITVDNVMDIIQDYDLIVDGSDNFETRYLVNDACYLAGKTNVHGSIFQFEGMATGLRARTRARAIAASTRRRRRRARPV
jgi:adenylyltransferase/sulfurtransferase